MFEFFDSKIKSWIPNGFLGLLENLIYLNIAILLLLSKIVVYKDFLELKAKLNKALPLYKTG